MRSAGANHVRLTRWGDIDTVRENNGSQCYDSTMAGPSARHAVQIGDDGSLLLPESVRQALGVEPGDVIVLTRESDGTYRLVNPGITVLPGGSEEGEEAGTDPLSLLRAGRGLWKDRDDLPDFEALRREWDRDLDDEG